MGAGCCCIDLFRACERVLNYPLDAAFAGSGGRALGAGALVQQLAGCTVLHRTSPTLHTLRTQSTLYYLYTLHTSIVQLQRESYQVTEENLSGQRGNPVIRGKHSN